jgi:DNA-directed RNA polymerase subunit A'
MLSAIDFADKLPKPAKDKYWTGKQIFSLLLPKDLNMEFRASICKLCDKCKKQKCRDDAYVVIKNGKVVTGTIDGRAVGAFKGKILDKIVRDYGKDAGREFIDKLTKLAIAAITIRGFTTGIDDEDIPEEAKKQIEEKMKKAENDVNDFIAAYKKGTLEQMPGRSLQETLEVEIMKVLGKARDEAGKIAGKHLGMDNAAVIMAVSGARGSMLNLSQMAGSIGQQSVRGERIKRGYQNRTLPHFQKDDLSSKARGFVKSSYKSGLTPTEYFFHSMGGREGLVDTAVRTSRSGYMQRRMINALEDLKVKYDGSVRNTAGRIIQFCYGEDDIDPTKSVRGEAVDVDDIVRNILHFEVESKEGAKEIKVAGEEEMGLPKEVEPRG